jgi:hypothetical protein
MLSWRNTESLNVNVLFIKTIFHMFQLNFTRLTAGCERPCEVVQETIMRPDLSLSEWECWMRSEGSNSAPNFKIWDAP